ncbi:MAG: tRNA 4-thiouridine(8) synthase ThiI [Deltaproteobacteria bacterium]|nr:tRNA 4-thiouridine(8) synthase ThiI [Deltaproteobacteria bacterium]MBW1930624.1 tRNA 4-thiouridine(8) synthase ThiI [Deltaproteobacteria bacterium]MBW2023964.1 tRNA 4-thiouridine(8) synthase ThiI [Deltaproteobacteria bacterium]MBW2124283.1 tRNA 4-thiouridine(8) synthase ThiI [Deltaproteobacteria bacterium]
MKALCVFSGGLDSMLAAEIIRAQGIDVLALFFDTPFFNSRRARKSADYINLPLKVVDITEIYLDMLRSPKYGRGKHMNPCIDCHALMCRIAGQMMAEEKAHFVVTGEVLGQRPMSQNRKSLDIIATESGLEGLLLRPLSAKHLCPTIPEQKGWVIRDQLLDIKGRSRKIQMELAERLGIKEYPSPAGGCLLTEEVFSRRLRDLMEKNDHITRDRIELLKLGRHFRISTHTKLVVGRNERENEAIKKLAQGHDLIFQCQEIPGPVVLLTGDLNTAILKKAAEITAAYSDAKSSELISVKARRDGEETLLHVNVPDKSLFRDLMI